MSLYDLAMGIAESWKDVVVLAILWMLAFTRLAGGVDE